MFLFVRNVLNAAEIEQLRQIARTIKFVDGRQSNPHNLAKKNLQADPGHPESVRSGQIAGAAITRSDEIRNFAFPKRIATPLLSRYEPGMNYGPHADAPFLQLPNGPMRSDLSATLFIEEPATYEGGELVIHLGSERHRFKGEPGSMIVYPSTTLHEVAPVTAGQRLSMFTFMESAIPNQMQRELLFTLNEVSALEGFNVSWENRTRLQFVIANLHRMWAG